MKRIKLFKSDSPEQLEQDVNKHIILHDDDSIVIDIRYNTYVDENGVETWTAMVIYEFKP